jgi:hypothetical protein
MVLNQLSSDKQAHAVLVCGHRASTRATARAWAALVTGSEACQPVFREWSHTPRHFVKYRKRMCFERCAPSMVAVDFVAGVVVAAVAASPPPSNRGWCRCCTLPSPAVTAAFGNGFTAAKPFEDGVLDEELSAGSGHLRVFIRSLPVSHEAAVMAANSAYTLRSSASDLRRKPRACHRRKWQSE